MKKDFIWTLVLNSLIVIAGGHGAAFLAMMEIFYIIEWVKIISEKTSQYKTLLNGNQLDLPIILTIIGQCSAFISFTLNKHHQIKLIRTISILVLLTGYAILVSYFGNNSVSSITVVTGIPFLCGALYCLYRLNFSNKSLQPPKAS